MQFSGQDFQTQHTIDRIPALPVLRIMSIGNFLVRNRLDLPDPLVSL